MWRNSEGRVHREDGPVFESFDGSKEWWIAGKLHRLDGPAVEWANGSKEWWVDGIRHREDGPAIEFSDGRKGYWIRGKFLSKADFEQYTKMKRSIKRLHVPAKTKQNIEDLWKKL